MPNESIDRRSTKTQGKSRDVFYNPSFCGETELDVSSEPMRNVTVIEIRRKAYEHSIE